MWGVARGWGLGRVAGWAVELQSVSVREVLLFERKLHPASVVIRPGRYFVRGLLLLICTLMGRGCRGFVQLQEAD